MMGVIAMRAAQVAGVRDVDLQRHDLLTTQQSNDFSGDEMFNVQQLHFPSRFRRSCIPSREGAGEELTSTY